MHTITKRLEICIDINIEISEKDYYTWIFTSQNRGFNKRGKGRGDVLIRTGGWGRGGGKYYEKKYAARGRD